MSSRSIAVCISLPVVIAVAVLVDRLIRPALRRLLDDITGLQAASEFYLRSFAIVVFFVAISNAIGSTHSELNGTSHFMEYVWSLADNLQDVMQGIFGVLLGYVAVITVLVAALRRRQS